MPSTWEGFYILKFLYMLIMVMKMVDVELANRYVIYDLVVRTLERDKEHLNKLKTGQLFESMYDETIKIAREERILIKQLMKNVDLRLDKEDRVDDLITSFDFIQKGMLRNLRYTNIALRNHTMKEIGKLFYMV